MKKIILASDSYKGCLSSADVASAAEEAILNLHPDAKTVKVSVADGGEGTVEALVDSLGGHFCTAVVSDPLGRPVEARYGIAGELAIVEVAAACGLTLLRKEERNPLVTSTKGVAEMLMDAASKGCTKFLVGLGGSATNDGGRGMVECPGFLDAMKGRSFKVACDVDTPFIGPDGASRVFGPQKGASQQDVEILDKRLSDYGVEILQMTGIDVRHMKGAGAAGGLGGAFKAFLGASLERGVEMVLDTLGFDETIKDADLVITGEGCSDFQTAKGKTPYGVLCRAKKQNTPVLLLSGAVRDCPELEALGFTARLAATPEGMPLEEAMNPETARQNIKNRITEYLSNYE